MPTDTTRTYGIHLYTPRGTDYRVEVERETIRTYENGDSTRIGTARVLRQFSEISTQALPSGSAAVATYGELAALISACATALGDEDAAAQAATPPIPAVSNP